MEPRRLLFVGAGFALLGVVLGLAGSVLRNDPSFGPRAPEVGMLSLGAGLTGMIGFLVLVWAIYKAADLPWLPPVLLAGLVLVFLSRFGSNLLGLAVSGGNDPAVSLMFTVLGTLGGLGTVLVLMGLFQTVHAKVTNTVPGRPAPAPAYAPPAQAPLAQPPPRRSSFRPPQAPLPPPRAPAASPKTQAPLPRSEGPK